jgi:hypothetical protein
MERTPQTHTDTDTRVCIGCPARCDELIRIHRLHRPLTVASPAPPHDGRARRLALTAHHHRFWRKRNPGDFGQVSAWTAALNDREVSATINALMQLHLSLRDDR